MTEPVRVTTAEGSAPTAVEAWALPELFRQVFVGSTAGIAIFDARGALVGANPALEAMLPPEDLATLFTATPFAADGVVAKVKRQFTDADGDPMWTEVALSVVRDSEGMPRWHVAVVEDTTEQRVLRDYLRHQALHDVLTGLPNRQSFLPKLEQVLSRPGSITLCYLDVDSVAIVNDGLGYEAGDELLKVVARRLTEVVSGEDATVARIGGDEFVVLIEDSPTTPGISALAEAIEAALVEPVRLAGHGVGVSAGMGFVRTSARGSDAMALLRQAHSTLRRAESGGKGQWGIYDAGQDARDRTRCRSSRPCPARCRTARSRWTTCRSTGTATRWRWRPGCGGTRRSTARCRTRSACGSPTSSGSAASWPSGCWTRRAPSPRSRTCRCWRTCRRTSRATRTSPRRSPRRCARSGLPPQRLWLSLSARSPWPAGPGRGRGQPGRVGGHGCPPPAARRHVRPAGAVHCGASRAARRGTGRAAG